MRDGGDAGPLCGMIRQLGGEDAEAYVVLRREALLEAPLAFASSPGDDFAATAEGVREHLRRAPEAVIFGAFVPELAGSAGIFRDRHLKAAHKAHLWGMYVTPAWRNRGIGAKLLEAAIAHARVLEVEWLHLGVSDATDAAKRLYERIGFETWGVEPDALRAGGVSAREYRMALRL